MAKLLSVLVAVTLAHGAAGRLLLSGLFNDSMVLQLGHPELGISATKIFGLAYTNETVVIEGGPGFPITKQTVTPVKSGPAYWAEPLDAPWGNWSVEIPPPSDVTRNYSFKVYIQEDPTDGVTVNDVVFGEVIVYGGQSNMELANYETDCHLVPMPEVADKVRIWYVHGNLSNDGLPQQTGISGFMPKHSTDFRTWVSNTVKTQYQSQFSGIAWAHSVRLAEWFYNTTGKTPYIGAVEQAIGGTSVQSWVPNVVSEYCNRTGDLPSTGECAQKAKGWIYNGRINPLSYGFSARHALWYQGEADSGENDRMINRGYACLLHGLLESWRQAFNSSMPWVIIQLPGTGGSPFSNDTDTADGTFLGWSAMQLAQRAVAESDPKTLLNPIPDQGFGGLHYSHKIDVANRALNLTRALVFGDTTIDVRMPTLERATSVGDLEVDLTFSNASGLHLMPSYGCDKPSTKPTVINTTKGLLNFTCCGVGGVGVVKLHISPPVALDPRTLTEWIPAELDISGDTSIKAMGLLPSTVSSPPGSFKVLGVSLNFGGTKCVLANANGIPAPLAANTPLSSL